MAVDPVAKSIVAQRRVMARVQKLCDEQGLPYPPELCEWLMSLQKVRGVH